MHFEDVKTTVKEHPYETVAVVTAVSLVGAIFYCNRQKKHQRELARLEAQANRPSWVNSMLGQRRQSNRYVLDFAA